MSGLAPKPFELVAGHPALDLVNTLDWRFSEKPAELLPTYTDLLRFTTQLQLLRPDQARKLGRTTSAQEGQRIVASVVELREALAAVLYAWVDGGKPPAGQVETLEKHFLAAAQHRRLRGGKSRLDWSWTSENEPGVPLWKLAQPASDLLLSSDAERVKDCGDSACRWLFLDVSKNHTRRWCNMKTCGNRMKARRHQARLHQTPL